MASSETTKVCRKCEQVKPVSAFYPAARARGGIERLCKACCSLRNKARYIAKKEHVTARIMAYREANPEVAKAASRRTQLKRYGITPEQYDAIVESQGERCAICRQNCPTGNRLAVDHDHDTGAVRGALCQGCNTSLGKLKDSPDNLAAALVYLAAHGKALSTEELADFLAVYTAIETPQE